MIVLTPELAEARIKARAVYPKATWLPGDEPPHGTLVRRQDGRTERILGAYEGKEDAFRWWWLLSNKNSAEMILEWPPCLEPVEEK